MRSSDCREESLEEGHEENGGNRGNERRDVNVNRNLEEERRKRLAFFTGH